MPDSYNIYYRDMFEADWEQDMLDEMESSCNGCIENDDGVWYT